MGAIFCIPEVVEVAVRKVEEMDFLVVGLVVVRQVVGVTPCLLVVMVESEAEVKLLDMVLVEDIEMVFLQEGAIYVIGETCENATRTWKCK